LFKAGNRSFDADYKNLSKDKDPDVAIQALLTLNLFKTPDMAALVKTSQESNTSRGVSEIGRQILAPATNALTGGRGGFSPAQQDVLQRGQTIYSELCFTCHGTDGHGQPLAGAAPGVTMAPPLAGSPRVQGHRDYVIKTILHGLSGPVDGTSYTQEMVSMKASQDDWIASVGSFIRNAFGNTGSFITTADVARVRTATAARKTTWTLPDLVASLPVELPAQPTWKATASHNNTAAASALTLQGWNTAARQDAGMWFQLELPEATTITELQFDSLSGARAGTPQPARGAGPGGGGGGRGAGGAPPDPAAQAAAQLAAMGFPRGYKVEASMDGKTWGKPIAEGAGAGARTMITFAPVRAKFIRITQTGSGENLPGWSITNLRVYQPGPGK
jgi:mono/diheme cytochrome c family protein